MMVFHIEKGLCVVILLNYVVQISDSKQNIIKCNKSDMMFIIRCFYYM